MATRRLVIAAIAFFWTLSASQTFAQSQKPGDMYLEFVAAAKKASAFDQIVPYLSTVLLKDLKAAPQEERGKWFKYMKDIWNLADITFTKESISGDRCVLEATAKNATGKSAKGKIDLVREQGVWKLDEEAWASEL
jgi:hypothetical protein